MGDRAGGARLRARARPRLSPVTPLLPDRVEAELSKQAEPIPTPPVLRDLSVAAEAEDLHGLPGGLSARRCQPEEHAVVRPAQRQALHDGVALGDLVLDGGAQIREGATQRHDPVLDAVDASAVRVGRAMGAVRSDELAGDGKVALGEQLVGNAASQGFELIRRHGDRSSAPGCTIHASPTTTSTHRSLDVPRLITRATR